jgi:prophage regulatory protein
MTEASKLLVDAMRLLHSQRCHRPLLRLSCPHRDFLRQRRACAAGGQPHPQAVVLAMTGFKNTHLYNFIQRGRFPAPMRISARAVAWQLDEVRAWIDSRASSLGGHAGHADATRAGPKAAIEATLNNRSERSTYPPLDRAFYLGRWPQLSAPGLRTRTGRSGR